MGRSSPTSSVAAGEKAFLHGVSGPAGTALADGASVLGGLRPLVGPFLLPVADVTGPERLLARARAGLPEGAARAEAVAVRLRREGVALEWGQSIVFGDAPALDRFLYERGRSSIDLIRADPSLLTELQVGSWFNAGWRGRLVRRAAVSSPRPIRGIARVTRFALDAAFWAGVRSAATAREWERLTRSSYVALLYHRLAGEAKPGQERLDLPPDQLDRQLRLLRVLGFRPLSPEQLDLFHTDPGAILPRRSYLLTADDGFRDCVVALSRHVSCHPQLFVPTDAIGGGAWWADGEPVATAGELREFVAAGGSVGSHGRSHPTLPELALDELERELAGSRDDLAALLVRSLPFVAYPHGRHDHAVRAATIAAGYRAAYTTEPGRNGAGTDPYCLRRIGPKVWDSPLAFLWKAITGELVPRRWERALLRRARRGSRPLPPTSRRTAGAASDRPSPEPGTPLPP